VPASVGVPRRAGPVRLLRVTSSAPRPAVRPAVAAWVAAPEADPIRARRPRRPGRDPEAVAASAVPAHARATTEAPREPGAPVIPPARDVRRREAAAATTTGTLDPPAPGAGRTRVLAPDARAIPPARDDRRRAAVAAMITGMPVRLAPEADRTRVLAPDGPALQATMDRAQHGLGMTEISVSARSARLAPEPDASAEAQTLPRAATTRPGAGPVSRPRATRAAATPTTVRGHMIALVPMTARVTAPTIRIAEPSAHGPTIGRVGRERTTGPRALARRTAPPGPTPRGARTMP